MIGRIEVTFDLVKRSYGDSVSIGTFGKAGGILRLYMNAAEAGAINRTSSLSKAIAPMTSVRSPNAATATSAKFQFYARVI